MFSICVNLFGLHAIESLNWAQVFAQRSKIGSQMKVFKSIYLLKVFIECIYIAVLD